MVGFLVEYTIHNDDNDIIRNIVEDTLLENGFDVCEGTTLYYKEYNNIRKIGIINNLDNICSNKRKELLQLIKNNAKKNDIYNISENAELQVFAIVGGSGY